MSQEVAVVTGANRGMGLETCRQLGHLGYRVILTARDHKAGEAAALSLQAEALAVEFHPLDVRDGESIAALSAMLRERYGEIAVLVNNAGILPETEDPTQAAAGRALVTSPENVRAALETNALGPFMLSQALAPLLCNGGRIVNVSSGMGQLAEMGAGWPGYRMSKTALNALTRIFAAELAERNIKVNAVCPGWVRTDMGSQQAPRSVSEGVDTTVWLATLPSDGPSGGFFRDRQPIAW